MPDQPDAPTSVLSGSNVLIQWTIPTDGSSKITGYILKIRQSDGVVFSETADCDGSNEAIAFSQSCLVPIATLLASPFNLSWGAKVFT